MKSYEIIKSIIIGTAQLGTNYGIANQEKSINIEFKAGSLGSLLRFTKANKGVTILPYLSAMELSQKDQQKLIPFESPVPARSVGLVTHRYFVKMKLLDKLQAIIKESVESLIPANTNTQILKPLH